MFDKFSGPWEDETLAKTYLTILVFFGWKKNSCQNLFDNWSDVWKEKLTDVVMVGGTNSRPKIDVSFLFVLGRTKCLPRNI